MKKLLAVLTLVVTGMGLAHAGSATSDRAMSETGLSYNKNYTFGLESTPNLSMQVVYGSATLPSKTFTDGTQSTGSFTVASNTNIQASSATLSITLSSTSATALTGQTVTVTRTGGNSIVFRAGYDFSIDAVSTNTACSLATAFTAYGLFQSTCNFSGSGSGVVYSTAPVGSVYNTYAITSSTLTAISSGTFSGGLDNATACLNGSCVTLNNQWTLGANATATATNLATAFNATAASQTVTSQGRATVVTATSTAVGTATAYAITSSSNAALTLSGTVTLANGAGSSLLTGGTNSGYSLATDKITIASHGFSTALPVLYTGTPAIGGLTTTTTYYVVVLDANTIGLSSTSVVAQAGNYIDLTSSTTGTTADTYTLAPTAIAGTPSFKWQVSNDDTNYVDLTSNSYNILVTSVTMSSYINPSTATYWDLGRIDAKKIRLSVIAPTQGAIAISAYLNGKN